MRLLGRVLRNKNTKGVIGEIRVQQILLFHQKRNYFFINNVKIYDSQIDHIVVTNDTVYVIETKNWQGLIINNGLNNWLQVSGSKKRSYYSPIKQNIKHLENVKKFLKYPDMKFKSIIVFKNSSIETNEEIHNLKTFECFIKDLDKTEITNPIYKEFLR